jgi:tRNA modification GTPase
MMTEINSLDSDTIAAIATAPGRGGIGIIRISGNKTRAIASEITGTILKPRLAHYGPFYEIVQATDGDKKNYPIDHGIALFFPAPHSFTGEDILELQAHGGPVLLDCLLKEVIKLGARLARPGEFSERAFLNNKIDLTQAEAIADLINSSSEEAAKNAVRSLQGEFSNKITDLLDAVINLRMYVEAAIDFPEEEIDFLTDGKVAADLAAIIERLNAVFNAAKQGALLQEGMTVVIAGKPNAGKSSLLNALSGRESAIVTEFAGTTRDVLREQILIDGMPLHIIDTAGLRESPDLIEQEGIRRAWCEIEKADRILLVVDSSQNQENDPAKLWPDFADKLSNQHHITIIHNKCDLSEQPAMLCEGDPIVIKLSAKKNLGIDVLREHLKHCMGYNGRKEGGFTARRRHIEALERASTALLAGKKQLLNYGAGELLAEDLRHCQNALNEITGRFTPDDLLAEIFSSFCIGK